MPENEPLNVEFIPAFEDAKLRRDCFLAIAQTTSSRTMSFEELLCGAKVLYAWCMESGDDADNVPEQPTDEDQCERKH